MSVLDRTIPNPVREYRLYCDAMRDTEDAVAIEHAALPNTRLNEAMAFALLASPEREVGYLTMSVSRDRYALERAMRSIGGKKEFSAGGCTVYLAGIRRIWFIDGKRLKSDDIPFSSLDALVTVDTHLVDGDLMRVLHRIVTRMTCVGAPSKRGDWWYDWSRNADALYKYDALQITDQWPDQIPYLLPVDAHEYNREMLCHEEPETTELRPFGAFASSRLFVRTDKTAAFLTPKQQAEAATQFGTPVVTFELSKLQRRYRAMKRHAVMRGKKPWYLLLKYRRGGFTTLEQGENYETCVQRPRSYVAALADTHDKMRRIFRIAKTFQEHDPRAPGLIGDSKTALEFTNRSFYFIGTAGSSGFARGDTLQRVHGSEVAKWCKGNQEQVEEVMAGILGAAEHGTIVLETTANGVEWFARTYRESKRGDNDFTPVFLPWFADPTNRLLLEDTAEILDTLTDEEKRLAAQHGLTAEQIAFRRDRKRAFGKLFPQEYPEDDETCFIVSGTPFFDSELIMALVDLIPSPRLQDRGDGMHAPAGSKHLPGGYEVRWEDPKPGVRYVLGADTSEGLPGCDRNGLGIMRKDTGLQVAAVHGLFNPRVLAEHICRMAKDYNNALVGIERENHGHAVIQKVMDLGVSTPHYRGGNLYYHSKAKGKNRDKAGWSTNAITRPVMLDQLNEYVEDGGADVIRDREFLSECMTFRLQRNGRFDHDPGAHDDTVFKWAVANQMRQQRITKPGFIA